MTRYKKGIQLLNDVEMNSDEEEAEQQKVLNKLYLNRAHVELRNNNSKLACVMCQEALKIKESDKAYYRLGLAKRKLGELVQVSACRELVVWNGNSECPLKAHHSQY